MSANYGRWAKAVDKGFEALFIVSLVTLAAALWLGGLENEFPTVFLIAMVMTVIVTVLLLLREISL